MNFPTLGVPGIRWLPHPPTHIMHQMGRIKKQNPNLGYLYTGDSSSSWRSTGTPQWPLFIHPAMSIGMEKLAM